MRGTTTEAIAEATAEAVRWPRAVCRRDVGSNSI